MKSFPIIYVLITLLASILPANAEPFANRSDRNAVTKASHLPSTVGEDNLLWRVPLKGGDFMNTITIYDGKVYCIVEGAAAPNIELGRRENVLLVFDARTGEILVEKGYSGLGGGYDAHAPLIEGDRLYTRTDGDHFICLNRHTGEVIWENNPVEQMGMKIQRCHGPNGNAIIIGDYYYVPTCATGLEWTPRIDELSQEWPWVPKIVAMNKYTGDIVAMDELEQEHFYHGQWSSVSTGKVNGQQVIFYGDGNGIVHAFKAEDTYPERVGNGDVHRLKHLWSMDANPPEYRYWENGLPRSYQTDWDGVRDIPEGNGRDIGPCEIIGDPVFKDGLLYVALARDYEYCNKRGARAFGQGGIMCIDPDGGGDLTKPTLVWRNLDLNRTFSTPSVTDDGLIFIADLAGQINCFDAVTGERLWDHDIKSKSWNYGQIVADGKVFVQNSTGDLYILGATREKKVFYEGELNGKNGPMCGVADGILVVATGNEVAAYGDPDVVKGPGSSNTVADLR